MNRALVSTRMTSWLMTNGLLPKSTKCPAKVSVLIATLRDRFPREMLAAEESARRKFGVIGGAARFHIVHDVAQVLGVDLRTGDEKAEAKRAVYQAAQARGSYEATTAFLQSYEWRRVRMEALKKHGARCMCCGATPKEGAVMNVDHIKPRKLFPELALDLSNLQVLCNPCNHGKGNWDMTDWREPLVTDWRVRYVIENMWAAKEFEACKGDWAAAGLDALVKQVLWDTKNGYCYVVEWHVGSPTREHWDRVREVFRKHVSQFEIDGICHHRDDVDRDYAVELDQ